jgi:Rieske Fe-S protein
MRLCFLGGSNYIGDVGPTTYIAPNETAFVLYKWKKVLDIPTGFLYNQSQITAKDQDSKEGVELTEVMILKQIFKKY